VRYPLALVLGLWLVPLASAQQAEVPVLFVHGFGSNPVFEFQGLLARVARGRPVYPEVYSAELDALPTGGVSPHSLFAFGYYRESAQAREHWVAQRPDRPSIGGCPTPRTDRFAARYRIRYAELLARAVENVCRATGAERVDLVGYSMGGLVCRSYTRWLSLRGPGGASRVRRLLTVCTPNMGLNSLEATLAALATNGDRGHADQGEIAEMNYECRYWGGRSFIERLNDGWDAFCRREGIAYGAARGYGFSIQHRLRVLRPLMLLVGLGVRLVLAHPTPGFDLRREIDEAIRDGDGVVRTAAAFLDPARFTSLGASALHFGNHGDSLNDAAANRKSEWTATLVRRFVFEGRSLGAPLTVAQPRLTVVDAGGEASWLELSVDVTAGEPLVAQVVLLQGNSLEGVLEGVLHPGANRVQFDPGLDGDYDAYVNLCGLGGELRLPAQAVRLQPGTAVPLPTARIGQALVATPQQLVLGVDTGGTQPELAFGLDRGQGVRWSPFAPAGLGVVLPPLPPGSYELRLRARDARNAAGIPVEAPLPDAVRIEVGPGGAVRLRR